MEKLQGNPPGKSAMHATEGEVADRPERPAGLVSGVLSLLGEGWLVQMLGAAVIAATVVLLLLRFSGTPTPPVVTFDIIKYENAERAMAAKFLVQQDPGDAGALLQRVSSETRAVIREIAGPGTLVVVKQAIIQGQTEDITNAVLTRLGLPTKVPGVTPAKYAFEAAPTLIGHGPAFSTPRPPAVGATTKPSVLP
ncbi:MAG: hypothetical protein RB191_05550 [Terriglobia bacterium]|nr:hypothetical protein [Terriglobia bacterium]